MYKFDMLRETALANLEVLFDFWGIEYAKINSNEYDLLATWRADSSFGAVRFNSFKGRGSDFAGISFTERDYKLLGNGFDASDYSELGSGVNTSRGFDIIGLCGKLYNIGTYKEAADRLASDLHTISKHSDIKKPSNDAAKKREEELVRKNKYMVDAARKAWDACKKIPLALSKGDIYLTTRGLCHVAQRETNVRFHPKIINKELGRPLPCLLFKVQEKPLGPLVAVHRIYLSDDGFSKADLDNPKMAMARVKGAGIWFGTPGPKLGIAEGPENALSIREIGFGFVVSTINATNFANISIPEYVTDVVLFPDPDPAGIANTQKAVEEYTRQGKKVDIKFPPEKVVNNKLLDWNDILQEAVA